MDVLITLIVPEFIMPPPIFETRCRFRQTRTV